MINLILMLILANFYTLECQSSESPESSGLTASNKYGKCAPCKYCTNHTDHNSTSNLRCCPSGCTTPEGLRGRCVGLHSCPRVLEMLRGNRSKASLEYFEESRCQGPDEYSICCNQDRLPNGGHCHLTAQPPDRSTRCCGFNVKENIKKNLGGPAYLDTNEHPWLATIVYVKDEEIQVLCGGALISGQYVVTAGHCVSEPMLDGRTPKYVHLALGQLNCNGEEGANCDEPVTVPIETTTPHPDYEPNINPRKNDIALIRLARIVEFADFIRPICLPSFDINAALTKDGSDVKIPAHGLPIIAMPDLSEMDHQSSDYVTNPAGSIIIEVEGVYELIGMATMKTKSCGEQTIDGSYSSAYLHMNWIRSQIAAEVKRPGAYINTLLQCESVEEHLR